MRSATMAGLILAATLLVPAAAGAQGIVRGAQEGAATGSRAAGPVGGAVGGAVGAGVGGAVGGVKGVLGVPQRTSVRRTSGKRKAMRRRR